MSDRTDGLDAVDVQVGDVQVYEVTGKANKLEIKFMKSEE